MDTKVIPLDELRQDLEGTLRRCADSGEAIVIELPDHRLLVIHPLEDHDDLVDELIAHNPAFRDLLARSHASPRLPFASTPRAETEGP